jgi:hypothetical protein
MNQRAIKPRSTGRQPTVEPRQPKPSRRSTGAIVGTVTAFSSVKKASQE